MKTTVNARRLLIAGLSLVFAALALDGLAWGGDPARGEYDWLATPAAALRTDAGECDDPTASTQEICVELCLVTLDGHVLPQGDFMCMPPSS